MVLERTVRELRGQSCLDLEQVRPTRQQIVVSRSFGQKIRHYPSLSAAVASFTARAAEKLRAEEQAARHIQVFIRTNPFQKDQPQHSQSAGHTLTAPSSDTRQLLGIAERLLSRIYEHNYEYAKAGVMLGDFYPPGVFQPSLFSAHVDKPDNPHLMKLLDEVNRTQSGGLRFGAQLKAADWQMKRERLSPRYTTRWADIPQAT